MGESWFQSEFLNPRRLVFNVIFYGVQFALFALGWYLQVSLVHLLRLTTPHHTL